MWKRGRRWRVFLFLSLSFLAYFLLSFTLFFFFQIFLALLQWWLVFFFPHTSLLFSLFFYPMMIRFFYTFLFSLKILPLFIVFFYFSQLLGEKGTKFHFGPFFLVLRFTYRPFFNLFFIIFLCFDFSKRCQQEENCQKLQNRHMNGWNELKTIFFICFYL
jgi:hypothetical protein